MSAQLQDLAGLAPVRPAAPARAAAQPRQRRMIDAPTRALHWWLALSVGLAWLSGDSERWRLVHVCMGYSAAALLLLEVLWGLGRLGLAQQPARLRAQFGKLGHLKLWWQRLCDGSLDLQLGQNLLLALSVALMLPLVLAAVLSGLPIWWEWLPDAATDQLAELHELLTNALMLVIGAHVAALLLGSWQRRRNLVAPMLSGCSSGVGPDLVRHNRRGLALLISAAVLLFWAWRAWLAWSGGGA